MKHSFNITAILLLIFILSQAIGLVIIGQYIDIKTTSESGVTTINQEKYFIEPPKVENESNSWTLLLFPILIGTAIILLLMKYKLFGVWKAWFFLSVTIALFLAIHPLISFIYNSFIISGVIAVTAAYFKIKKPNVWIHNSTEILLYGGIAALFVPIINVTSGVILLILISIYDIVAVWFSKHMVAMAKFQTQNNAFAGIHIPKDLKTMKVSYANKEEVSNKTQSKKRNSAILGGGDIAFPLIFAGAILKSTGSFYLAGIVSAGAFVALTGLFLMSKEGKFYPAMPFISAGCFAGFGIIQLF